ncbi:MULTISPECIES: sulfurtransferase TusA family protein [unclassified Methanoculleus]|uniref:sulfurtransferase TusA family protein n=1 Tax=unclassified Methanoculleus TaxID=2619537 RepID=UPI0025D5064B|nr:MULTISPECIES: sulfurtransferase TusA family protein [unclassified Methanoculleus]MCK9317146.1 sulfurtransferase TusA family protein [Methanoculleus sp.]MDD2254603.1 sulfurtransferase TusA family protein [Methanoculleus sp.]MDD2788344.1 sulfurtransferase TusA family protein [Methanoculleus sp.]MDD3217086.1 sulfurtransferase TusA family protein [Methanoculleus sp.]MDD4314581.1 sulfurtransferase TusA family protein [Methanoculleus sp.]
MDADGYVDARGAYCQAPITLLKEGMDGLVSGGILKVEMDNAPTEEDVRVWARRMGHEILGEEREGEKTTFSIQKRG